MLDSAAPSSSPAFEVKGEDGHVISDDFSRIDLDLVHGFLTKTYWSPEIPRETVERAWRHSLAFGLYAADGAQVGGCRVVTDRATFAYLADVFVLESQRGKGLSKWLMRVVFSHPDLQGLRRFMLATRDAHGLYTQYGFTALSAPERLMERVDPDVYRRKKQDAR
ncbi:GNAT family N-acetyltransferase [Myxococcus fulvus]|uniref:GNAT family N-acetyltransferase n=1 Tax=Myxococcus fulvus TaxID=33 RepID=UPI003B9B1EA7